MSNANEMGYFANGQGLDPPLGALTSRCGTQVALGYCNTRIDELFDLGPSESEQAKRAPYYQEIAQIQNAELPRAWLWYEVRPLAFNKRVVGPAEHFGQMPNLIFDVPVYNEVELSTFELMGTALLIAVTLGVFLVQLSNLATDVLYGWLDPQIRYD